MKLRWTLVQCAGGASILALVDARRWNGWLVPWFPDSSMERIAVLYYADAEERAPQQALCGTWDMRDDDAEPVTLERVRKSVPHPTEPGESVWLALSDASEMGWCWEEVELVRRHGSGTANALALELASFSDRMDPVGRLRR